MKRVTLYTRLGCHLCDAAQQVISSVRVQFLFDLVIENVDGDSSLRDRYGMDVPVILVDGREIARHRLTAQALRAALGG